MVEFHDDFAQVFEKIVGDYHSKSPFLALLLEEGGDNKFIKFLKAKNTQSVDNENQEFIRLQITDWDQKGMEFYWFLIEMSYIKRIKDYYSYQLFREIFRFLVQDTLRRSGCGRCLKDTLE